MENLNDNGSINNSPVVKKKWEKPQLIIISTNDVNGGGSNNNYPEQSFKATGSGKYAFQNDPYGYSKTVYNFFVS